jgi:hypothetical protein
MAHAYTPGLKVTEKAIIKKDRRLPLKGQVLVKQGDAVTADQIVAKTELPGNVQTVNVAGLLGLLAEDVPSHMLKKIGDPISKDEPIAISKGFFGLFKSTCKAPVTGTIESISQITGQVIVREPPLPVQVKAYIDGTITQVNANEGVIVEAFGTFVQGIFGIGGETFGTIEIVAAGPDLPLDKAAIGARHRGRVIVAGAYASYESVMACRAAGVAAIVVGGIDDHDLRQLLGRDLGVAITGSEDLGITVILTEGFGHIRMAERTWSLLSAHAGQVASVSGATQIRAGVMRPEIIIPSVSESPAAAEAESGGALEVGSLLRVIRAPHFGRIGRAVGLPAALQALDSEATVRVLEVAFLDDGSRSIVPRANVERIAE